MFPEISSSVLGTEARVLGMPESALPLKALRAPNFSRLSLNLPGQPRAATELVIVLRQPPKALMLHTLSPSLATSPEVFIISMFVLKDRYTEQETGVVGDGRPDPQGSAGPGEP